MTAPATSPPARPGRVVRRRPLPWKDYLLFVLFAAPNLTLLTLFTYRPLIQNLQFSTIRWDMVSPEATSVGMGNFVEWFKDPASWVVLRNTAVFTVVGVAGTMLGGLALALLLNQKLFARDAARAVLFAPFVLANSAVAVVWLFMFDPNYGLVQAMLAVFDLPSPDWYKSPGWAMVMLCVVYIWKNLGYTTVIYLAGLQAVPRDLLEAAQVDGAGRWARLRHVTLPQLSAVTFFLSVTTMLSSMQAFDIISVMTQGGPLDGTRTLVYEVYEQGFIKGQVGKASAVATVLFVVMLVITILQVRVLERRVLYS